MMGHRVRQCLETIEYQAAALNGELHAEMYSEPRKQTKAARLGDALASQ